MAKNDTLEEHGIAVETDGKAARKYKTFPIENPNVLVATCMKDEGPFILEWLAWHMAIGVTNFVIFTNDCSDGTDLMFDHLMDRGLVHHLPNPVLAMDSGQYFQPTALKYVQLMKEFREADYFISMDVDEFINVRAGDGTLKALFDEVGDFDALSMNELNHGSNEKIEFEKGWVKEQFKRHQSERPGNHKAHRGVKTITKISKKLKQIRNHRPDFYQDKGKVNWVTGAAKPVEGMLNDASLNGYDCRGQYEHVTLNHFPLRSRDSYLAKALRGDVVVKDKMVSARYWRVRNFSVSDWSNFDYFNDIARKVYDEIFAGDPKLMALQEWACVRHQENIDRAKAVPDIQELEARLIEMAAEKAQLDK